MTNILTINFFVNPEALEKLCRTLRSFVHLEKYFYITYRNYGFTNPEKSFLTLILEAKVVLNKLVKFYLHKFKKFKVS